MNTAQILPDLRRISCSGDFLSDFVESFPGSCAVQDAYTRKYLFANYYHANWCGLDSIDDLIGITPIELWLQDVLHRRSHLNLNPTIISDEERCFKSGHELGSRIILTKRAASINLTALQFNGLIRCENVIKFPVQNRDQKVVAFLTIFLQFTDQVPLQKLLRLYQEFYPRKEATQKFLKHLNIDRCFNPCDPPTYTEIQVLLYMCEDSRCKAVANRLGVTVATASNHISRIREKLLKSFDIPAILRTLRTMPVNAQSSPYGYVL